MHAFLLHLEMWSIMSNGADENPAEDKSLGGQKAKWGNCLVLITIVCYRCFAESLQFLIKVKNKEDWRHVLICVLHGWNRSKIQTCKELFFLFKDRLYDEKVRFFEVGG